MLSFYSESIFILLNISVLKFTWLKEKNPGMYHLPHSAVRLPKFQQLEHMPTLCDLFLSPWSPLDCSFPPAILEGKLVASSSWDYT